MHTTLAAYVDTMLLISYVLDASPLFAQSVKPVMLESLGTKHLKSLERREKNEKVREGIQCQEDGVAKYNGSQFFSIPTKTMSTINYKECKCEKLRK